MVYFLLAVFIVKLFVLFFLLKKSRKLSRPPCDPLLNRLLKHAEPVLMMASFGQVKKLPISGSNTITFKRHNCFAVEV